MQITDRKQAQKLGLTTFFTNKICVNGHLSYRYTQSGACSECINGDRNCRSISTKQRKLVRLKSESNAHEIKMKSLRKQIVKLEIEIEADNENFKSVLAERRQILEDDRLRENQIKLSKLESKEVLKNFVKFNEPVHLHNVIKAKSLLMAYAIMRNEFIKESDLWLTALPKHGVLYTLLAHPDDLPSIRDQLRQWYSANSNVAAIQQKITNATLSKYDKPSREGSIDDITK